MTFRASTRRRRTWFTRAGCQAGPSSILPLAPSFPTNLATKTESVPSYVVMGYPNITRDPGFLGAKYGYVYLTQIETGPNGLIRPPDVDSSRQDRRETLLATMRDGYVRRNPNDQVIQAQTAVSQQGFKMAGPRFLECVRPETRVLHFARDLRRRVRATLPSGGRLVQSGVRFVEVSFNLNFLNGSGWDTHNEGQLKQHLLIQDLDQALATLLRDLETNKMLDTTLVVVATEFGRPPEFDSGGGRGHHSKAFSALLAGGGLRTGQVIGVTDDLGKVALERPVSIPDFHATIHCALGIDPAKNLYAGDRPVPITDHGKPISELFV